MEAGIGGRQSVGAPLLNEDIAIDVLRLRVLIDVPPVRQGVKRELFQVDRLADAAILRGVLDGPVSI